MSRVCPAVETYIVRISRGGCAIPASATAGSPLPNVLRRCSVREVPTVDPLDDHRADEQPAWPSTAMATRNDAESVARSRLGSLRVVSRRRRPAPRGASLQRGLGG